MTLYGANLVFALLILGNIILLFNESSPVTGVTNVAPYRIHLQSATASELELLPGIGPAIAERIVAYRADHIITVPDDLIEIHGIGQITVDGIRRLVSEEPNDQ